MIKIIDTIQLKKNDTCFRKMAVEPLDGILLILEPEDILFSQQLAGKKAQIIGSNIKIDINIFYSHNNPSGVVGLVCKDLSISDIPRESKIKIFT